MKKHLPSSQQTPPENPDNKRAMEAFRMGGQGVGGGRVGAGWATTVSQSTNSGKKRKGRR